MELYRFTRICIVLHGFTLICIDPFEFKQFMLTFMTCMFAYVFDDQAWDQDQHRDQDLITCSVFQQFQHFQLSTFPHPQHSQHVNFQLFNIFNIFNISMLRHPNLSSIPTGCHRVPQDVEHPGPWGIQSGGTG